MLRNKKSRNKPFGIFSTMFSFMGIQSWVWSHHSRPFCSFLSWKPVNPKGNQSWIFTERTDAEAEAPILWACDVKSQLIGKKKKNPDTGKDWGQEEKRATEDEMVGRHHQLTGHEFEQAPGDGEGQGSLVCHSPWGHKESDTIEWLNNNKIKEIFMYLNFCYLWITWGLCL